MPKPNERLTEEDVFCREQRMIEEGHLLIFTRAQAVYQLQCFGVSYADAVAADRASLRIQLTHHLHNNVKVV